VEKVLKEAEDRVKEAAGGMEFQRGEAYERYRDRELKRLRREVKLLLDEAKKVAGKDVGLLLKEVRSYERKLMKEARKKAKIVARSFKK
jgi:vacuolar-type H+-ATPase subunit H